MLTSPGIALIGPRSPRLVTQWARAAERAGLGSVWFIEDYFQPGAYALAGAAAAVTERVAIGLGVVNPFTRHPAVLAMETGTLAGLAPGRIILGLGTSNPGWIRDQMGIPFAAPLQALRESVEIVRRLWSGERLSYAGSSFTLQGVKLDFTPAQTTLPVLLGVKGPRAVTMAGEIADGVLCSILSSPGHVRRIRASTAERRSPFNLAAYIPMLIDADGERARHTIRPFLARYLAFLHGQSILRDAGIAQGATIAIREAVLAGRPVSHLVTEAMIDETSIVGTPHECRMALARWAEAGLDTPVAVVPPDASLFEQLARIGKEIGPFWREMSAR
jgi:alkanesulfonate monooxygenase SsuD/methylene tetrahydromethanopterin reductase-like flavin-dependent oxidoreductase (luciferase family)